LGLVQGAAARSGEQINKRHARHASCRHCPKDNYYRFGGTCDARRDIPYGSGVSSHSRACAATTDSHVKMSDPNEYRAACNAKASGFG
jgi:hypothetical protein